MKKYQLKYKLFCISLCFFMSACASEVVPVYEIQKLKIPEALLLPTTTPVLKGDTNGDLVNLLLQYQQALNLCNADKASIKILNAD